MKRTISVGASFVFTASVLVAACGGSSSPPPQQPQPLYGAPGDPNAQYGQPGAQPGQYGTPAAPGAPGAPGVPAAAPTPAAAPAPAAPAAPAVTDAATAAAVRLALTPRAATEAKGMKEDGTAIGGMMNEGAELTQEFNLMPGKCYTILGQGLPPISELDMTLSLKLPVPGLPAVLAQDQTTGPSASIGSGTKCYKYPFPIAAPVVLSVKATKGSGPAGAQVYSK